MSGRRVLNDDGSVSYHHKEVVAPKEVEVLKEVKPLSEKDLLTKEALELGIKVKRNWGVKKLESAIAEANGETEEEL